MLTSHEENYLNKIPEDKIVIIKPYSSALEEIAYEIIDSIKEEYPNLEIFHMGASALKISGQGDIDIYCLTASINFHKYLPYLKELFGEPKYEREHSVGWELEREGYPIELYLTDPDSEAMQRQITIFEKLKNNPDLLEEYKNLKESMNGKSFREYQRQKYEFYHKVLID